MNGRWIPAGFLLLCALWPGEVPAEETVPLTWQECVETALARNPELAQAVAVFGEADGNATQLYSGFYPKIGARAVAYTPLMELRLNQEVLNASQGPAVRMARASKELAVANLELSMLSVLSRLRMGYVSMVYIHERIQLQYMYVGLLTKQLESARDLFDAGRVKMKSIQRIEVNLEFARNELSELQTQAEQGRIQMADLMGIQVDDPLLKRPLANDYAEVQLETISLEQMTSGALKYRPDLNILRRMAEIDKDKGLLATPTRWPMLSFNARSELSPLTKDPLLGLDVFGGAAGNEEASKVFVSADVQWVLFNGGRDRGTVQEAQALSMARQAAVSKIEQEIPGQIRAALAQMQQAKNDLSAFSGSSSGDIVELAKAAQSDFERGKADQVDLFYAHQERQRMEESILKARYNYQVGYTQLLLAAGRFINIQHPGL